MDPILEKLKSILENNKDKCVSVIGTTCTGKTTFLKNIPDGIEISKLAPPLTKEEHDFYYNAPLTRENNKKMIEMRAGRAFVKAGQPAFGTAIVPNTELVVYLTISDELLKKRTESRNVDFSQAKLMQTFIEEQIKESGLPVIELFVG
jgi:ABC-type phosphate transport system ATPase subunit